MSRRRARAVACSVPVLLAMAMVAACGSSSSKSGSAATTTSAARAPQLKQYGPGVTADSVKVGIVMINYGCIKQFVDSIRTTQQKTYDLYIKYINSHGGVAGGKKIVPVYKTYCPVTNTGEIAACTSLTEDDKVFMAWGTFYDPTGDAQLCFA